MAFFFKSLIWLSMLGGAAAGIGLPTNNIVRSILNKQEIRRTGWNTKEGKDYENYWYGEGGFGDSRTKKVSNGKWTEEIQTSLKSVREEWGKNKLGEGLAKNFSSWLKKKNLCQNGSSGSDSTNNECYVGDIEFIEEKDKSLFGRIPLETQDNKKVNVYVKWYKCKKSPKTASGIWFGRTKKQGEEKPLENGKNGLDKYKWCLDTIQSQ